MADFEFSLLAHGGPMMIVLLIMAVAGVVLFTERTLFLHRGQIKSTSFVDGIKNILAKRRVLEALTVCEETPGPVAAVVKASLLHVHDDAVKMRFAVQEAGVVEIPALERRLGLIAAIAQVAPLVGLLGTVLGMATTFYAFMSGGAEYATASALADGMWQALLVTIGSLIIAIPSHLAYHFLSGRVRAIVRDVEWAGNEIMRYLQVDYRMEDADGSDKANEAPPAPWDSSSGTSNIR
ncbi:MAG: MotA/TolQ/ExbB proton channel family protein [Candidatus Synoicihabitans palmerolidicus]|nr:MotA/TolQ/ExbB proton channel family protein [Candidatus Synoicihabitans palmerolidicus]